MNQKALALLAIITTSWLSAYGTVAAEDLVYYGFGDSDNTGDISDVNWVLENDYRFYGGHQCFYNAYTLNGTASDSTMTINGGTYAVNGDVASGSGRYANYFYGGFTGNSGSATNNGIIINNGNFINESGTWQAAGIYAAKATGTGHVASDNYVTVNSGSFQGYTYISAGLGYAGSDAVRNKVTVNDGAFEKGIYIFGGRAYSTGNTDYNTVNVNGGNIGGYRAFIWGGKADSGDARYNTVHLSGGAVASIPSDESIHENSFTEYEQGDAEFYGGYTLSGNALYNTININGGSISTNGKGLAYGGYSRSSNANHNKVNVSGGTISSKMILIGGFSAGGNASGNTINLIGGSGNGEVYLYGGMTMSDTGNATGNKIAVYFPARLNYVYGGVYLTGNDTEDYVHNLAGNGDLRTGNELYLASSGISANNIYNFETLSFYVPSSYRSSNNMLTLSDTESIDLTDTNLALSAAGDATLMQGQTINLISSQGELHYGGQTDGTLKQGVSASYGYTVKTDSHNLQAVLGESKLNGETKSPVETRAAQAAFLNRGADLLATDGMYQAEKASRSDGNIVKGEWSPFFAMQSGKYRYQTGSHIDSRGFSAVLGLAGEIGNHNGKLVYGLVGEYGKGSYDSYYENMHGEGDNDYAGAAVFVRQKDNGGMYYEGSLRAGKTKSDYKSRNFTGYDGIAVGYDTDSNYLGAHLGLGKVVRLNDNNKLDVSLRYFYSHTGNDSARMSTGEIYDFSAVNSHRLRLGAKLTRAFNEESKVYFGAYFERELDGNAKAVVLGHNTAAPSLKGNSGIFEIGWLHQPQKSNFTLNVGIVAACGKQQGGAGKVSLMWQF